MVDNLPDQLRGRAAFCHNRKEVKTPELLETAADRIEALEAELATIRAEQASRPASGEGWTDKEQAALTALAQEQELSEHVILRQALYLYQKHHMRLKAGETVYWSGDEQRLKDFAGPLYDAPLSRAEPDVERVAEAVRDFCCDSGMIQETFGDSWLDVGAALQATLAEHGLCIAAMGGGE